MTDRVSLAGAFAEAGRAFLIPNPEAEAEYTRLFLSPLGAPCPPWQSVYQPPEGEPPRLMGEPHHKALAWYRAAGFEPAATNEPADHIGLLLLFYARLLSEETPDGDLARFRGDHFTWMPEFLEKVIAEARHPFYAGLARTTLNLIAGQLA
jgi:TorA maturation chaperone TorD